jgi:DNA-directed RNA polymerase subunit M/transcription elongation factor TFIIS
MKEKSYVTLMCRKCESLMHTGKEIFTDEISNIVEMDCPNCGEEGSENWILIGLSSL